ALCLLCGMVLRVLGQVPVLTGIRDLLNDARTHLGLEAVQFGLELLEPLDRHRHFFHGLAHIPRAGSAPDASSQFQSHPVSGVWPALSGPAPRAILRMRAVHRTAAAPL